MAFIEDAQELKPGLLLFRRGDVSHSRWYCRIKLPNEDRYKTISLKTTDLNDARDRAFDHDADIRFRVKHEVPVFDKSFAQVAKEFVDFSKARWSAGEITRHRYRVIESHVRCQLNKYVGSTQITVIGEDRWKSYPAWRQETGKGRTGGRVSEGTIRDEMATFRAVLGYAASKRYIRDSQVPKGRLPLSKQQREEFTPTEYRALHTFARSWIKQSRSDYNRWYRTIVYNFILVMTNTGMRPSEARNLLWRDVDVRQDRKNGQDYKFVVLSVRGKKKFRNLVAPSNVADYLERIREISKATGPNDFVFSTFEGKTSIGLYRDTLERLLIESKLLLSSTGKRRSTYCFRHTYATFRLTEGVDVYFLAKQMGTSVKMIEDHYGHITPVKNAERILQGMPGWEPIDAAPAKEAGVNTGAPGKPSRDTKH